MGKVKSILEKLFSRGTDKKHKSDNERIVTIDHRCEAVGWRPLPYTMPERFSEFQKNLDSDIDSFIKKANPDQYNKAYFDAIIDEEVKLALCECEPQRTNHGYSIADIEGQKKTKMRELDDIIREMEEHLDELRRYIDES